MRYGVSHCSASASPEAALGSCPGSAGWPAPCSLAPSRPDLRRPLRPAATATPAASAQGRLSVAGSLPVPTRPAPPQPPPRDASRVTSPAVRRRNHGPFELSSASYGQADWLSPAQASRPARLHHLTIPRSTAHCNRSAARHTGVTRGATARGPGEPWPEPAMSDVQLQTFRQQDHSDTVTITRLCSSGGNHGEPG